MAAVLVGATVADDGADVDGGPLAVVAVVAPVEVTLTVLWLCDAIARDFYRGYLFTFVNTSTTTIPGEASQGAFRRSSLSVS